MIGRIEMISSDEINKIFYNEDGTFKQSILDSMDKHFEEHERARKEYIEKFFDEDYEVVFSFVKEHGSLDDDEFLYDEEKALKVNDRIIDIGQFGNVAFTDYGIDIDEKLDGCHIGARKYKELRIDLFCGQGSFFRFSNYKFVDNGAGI